MTVQTAVSDPATVVRRWDEAASRGEKARAARELGVFPTAVSAALRAAKRDKTTSLTEALAKWILVRSEEPASDPDFVKLANDLLSLIIPSRGHKIYASDLIAELNKQYPYTDALENADIEDVITRLFPVTRNLSAEDWEVVGYVIDEA